MGDKMPRKSKLRSPPPAISFNDSESPDELKLLKERLVELERRLNVIEEKLNDLSEQFLEEFGEDFEQPEDEK